VNRALLYAVLALAVWLLCGASRWQRTSDTEKCADASVPGKERIAACTRAIKSGELSPENLAITFNNRGIARQNGGDYDRAIADYDEAILLDPELEQAYTNRGSAWDHKGQYDRAITDYDEAIRLNPELAQAYTNRGSAWYHKGDYDRAIADQNEALRLDPQLAQAYTDRGIVNRSEFSGDSWV
jgi:tetratricopeptide (TPR) repeat protein